MIIDPSKAVCFTGHRPEKLPDGGISSSNKIRVIKSMLYSEIMQAADRGYDTFITGMQRGIDLWAGDAVMSLSAERNLKLVAVLPYKNMGRNFKNEDKWIFGRIMENADEIVIISDEYTKTCMYERNRYMVDNSSMIIAVIGDRKSGTGQTLSYAAKKQLEIKKIDLGTLFPDAENQQLSLL